jgi:hypothetical protein
MSVLHPIRAPNGFTIVPIHYSHDVEKDTAWAARERLKYTAGGGTDADWQREMEIDFTAQAGALAYPSYRSSIHLIKRIEPVAGVPLCLAADFNVQPMVWVVAQVLHGWVNCLRTIGLSPATVARMVVEFRNCYPSHNAELWIYGDATGSARDHQTGQTDYDLIRIAFGGYNAPLVFKVPLANPLEKDRLNAVNVKLLAPDGRPGIRIDAERCPELVEDFEQVVLDSRGKIAKTYDSRNPYSRRTHASDALGYLVTREWPVGKFKRAATKPAAPLKYGRVLGDI